MYFPIRCFADLPAVPYDTQEHWCLSRKCSVCAMHYIIVVAENYSGLFTFYYHTRSVRFSQDDLLDWIWTLWSSESKASYWNYNPVKTLQILQQFLLRTWHGYHRLKMPIIYKTKSVFQGTVLNSVIFLLWGGGSLKKLVTYLSDFLHLCWK